MCGASSQQNQIEASQQQFYTTLIDQSKQEFGLDSSLYKELTSAFAPVFDKGPSQEGFSAAEKTALDTQATEGVATNYQSAAKNIREQEAAEGGGNVAIPSGQEAEINAEVAQSAAQQQSSEENQITQADYQQGFQNWESAAQGMLSAPGVFGNSAAAANAATSGGSAASSTANQIAQENNSWVGAVTGMIGGIGGSFATGGLSKMI